MGGLVAALFSTTLVFMVIFIPVSFMGGTSGEFYKQFGLTMAVAVGISFVSALTLSPALCALILRPNPEEGKQSALFAAKMRLRPVLMTALTMVFGMIPLAFASGVGANGSQTIGIGTIGGMLVGCVGLLFTVPVLFIVFQTLQEKVKPLTFKEPTDPLIINELKLIKEYSENKKAAE